MADAIRVLRISFLISFAVMAVEAAGGLISGSLALFSDAGHMFMDTLALGLGLIAAVISRRPLGQNATFGYHRVGVLAAVINGIGLLFISSYIFYEAVIRLMHPRPIDLAIMLPVAILGLIANLVMAALLHKTEKTDLNIRAVWLHVLGDTLSSIGVITSGVVIYYTGWRYADPIAGLAIGIIIITGGLRVLRDASLVFLDFVPKGYSVQATVESILSVAGVKGVCDVHLRSLSHGKVELIAHIWVEDQRLSEALIIKNAVTDKLRAIGITHIVLELDHRQAECDGILCRELSQDRIASGQGGSA